MKIHYLPHQQIDRTRWDECVRTAYNTLPYAYSWYLDIVARKQWDGLVMGEYEAVMPLVWNRKLLGLKQLYQPLVSQQLGVFGKNIKADIVSAFLKKIPPIYRRIRINLNEATPPELLVLPQMSQLTNLVLPLQDDYKTIRAGYGKSLKKRLRKSEELLQIEEGGEVADLVAYYREAMQAKITLPEQEWSLIKALFTEVIRRDMGKIYRIIDPANEVVAYGIFLLCKNRVFNVFAASNSTGKSLFAMHFLLDQIIQQYAGKMEVLDFEGSQIPGVARFFLSFGALERPYFHYESDRLPAWARAVVWAKKNWTAYVSKFSNPPASP